VSADAAWIASFGFARNKLAPVTLVVGKGGVGKTTLAAKLANHFADEGRRTLVVTTDPAATLLTALGRPITRTRRPLEIREQLDAWAFDTPGIRDEFLERWREPIAAILDRGTYLDAEDINGLVDAALPGADEIFAVLTLGEYLAEGQHSYERIVVDTAPTGHTLRLLTLPRSFEALVRLLDAMQEKHRFMVRALTHRYRSDAADALIDELRERVESLQKILADPARCRAVLVTRDEPVVQAETERYRAALQLAGIAVAAVETVACHPEPLGLQPAGGGLPTTVVQPAARSPQPEGLRVTQLLIVGGKGGVGKTTTACALAIKSADAGASTLLVSTDPAPSIADALGIELGSDPRPAAPNLIVQQLDATSAFARFRDEYRGRIDALFDGIAGRGVDIAHDRGIIRDLFALAPPGIDELYALTVLGEELEQGRFQSIVIDPAPTGHLLRLLDMPKLAVAWSHQLMRMMLKYREVVSLGDAGQDLLDFVRRTRALDERLHDAARSSTVIVALDEPLVREETGRLASELLGRGLRIDTIIWNRAGNRTVPLPTDAAIPQLFAPPVDPPPVGIEAIRAWSMTWASLT
jgi:arsenite/tail-anchored protein-transporting ATPase